MSESIIRMCIYGLISIILGFRITWDVYALIVSFNQSFIDVIIAMIMVMSDIIIFDIIRRLLIRLLSY